MAAKQYEQKLHEFAYNSAWAEKRLKDIVREAMPILGSRHTLLVITNGLVSVGSDVVADADAAVPEGTAITIDLRHGIRGRGDAEKPHLHERMKVYYEDDQVVVVSKNAGTPVQPTEEDDDGSQKRTAPLIELLKHFWRAKKMPIVNPILVQRLDQGTSGLMVLAKTPDAARHLQAQLRPPRRLHRDYLAIVAGVFQMDKGTWKTHIGPGKIGLRQSVNMHPGMKPGRAQYAETRFEVLERGTQATLLRLSLETGRTHQIRIHCAEAGHPVLGDDVYTRLAVNVLDRFAKGKATRGQTDHPHEEAEKVVLAGVLKPQIPEHVPRRLALHATRLVFVHPAMGKKKMSFEEPLPEMLKRYKV